MTTVQEELYEQYYQEVKRKFDWKAIFKDAHDNTREDEDGTKIDMS